MPVERNWKKAYQEGFDEHGQSRSTEPTGLTQGQKSWLVRAWTAIFGEVPNAMPEEERDDGRLAVRKSKGKTNWHHVYPQGASVRLTAQNPDYPENVVPLDEFNHTGAGMVGECDDDSPVIHKDTARARQHYKPGQKPSTFDEVNEERRQQTEQGEDYWDDSYDGWFGWLASMVTGRYKQEHPEDQWPQRRRRK